MNGSLYGFRLKVGRNAGSGEHSGKSLERYSRFRGIEFIFKEGKRRAPRNIGSLEGNKDLKMPIFGPTEY